MTETQHKRKPQTRKLAGWKMMLFRLVAAVLPLLALEAAARVYWVQFVEARKSDDDLYQEMLGEKVVDDEAPYQFFPNHEFDVAGTPTRTNNLGLRGDYDIDPKADYDGVRILCIGDSVTFGYTVSGNAAAYPAVLERDLRGQGVECQVLNGGMPRFRIEHSGIFFADHLRHLDSDMILILGGWNNANDDVLKPTGTTSWTAIVERHWYLLKVVRHWDFIPRLGEQQHAPARIELGGLQQYGSSLRRFVRLARDSGSEPILCTLPHFFHNLNDQAARKKAATFAPLGTLEQLAEVADAMNDQIRTVALSEGTPVIDLGAVDKHELFSDAIHPNDEGSAMIAELVEAYLSKNRLADYAESR